MANPPRRPANPMAAAEAAFKPVKKPSVQPVRSASVPPAREQVTLRIDRDVLDYFQQDGAGWQDRLNAALRKAIEAPSSEQGTRPEDLNATNDD